MLEIKSFVSSKNVSFLFGLGYISEGKWVKFSQIFRGVAHRGGGGEGGSVKRGEINISGCGWYPGGYYVVNSGIKI